VLLSEFAEVAAAIAATPGKSGKESILASYFASLDDASLERAAVFFTGAAFPLRDPRTTGVGFAAVSGAVEAVTGASAAGVGAAAAAAGDLGDAAETLFAAAGRKGTAVTVAELGEAADHLAATSGGLAKRESLTALFARLSPQEARFATKLLLGEFRIGLQTGLVEAAIARAFGARLAEVRRAHMFTGDIGTTALKARGDALDAVEMTLFHPVGFMLAQPEERPGAIIEQLGSGALADDKYDGIRAQLHAGGGEVRIYSRTLDDITGRFPEIAEAGSAIESPVLLDGEIVAFRGRILPFATLQSRLGRRKVTAALLEKAPVVFFAFDILHEGGEPLFDTPLTLRLERLGKLVPAEGTIRRSFQRPVTSAEEIEAAFGAARRRANEGLVVKAPDSLYTPGRRGKSWLKYKKALATLDCVVTRAEYGHGKRRGVLSDYTFAIDAGGELKNIGKAYSGLTDVEIERLTRHFQATTTARFGRVHVVEPTIVLEIAFDRIQQSSRHASGYSLRFPRIARIRDDKTPPGISTLDDVRRIYEGQLRREEGSDDGSGDAGG
jgi:DNA ligase 1